MDDAALFTLANTHAAGRPQIWCPCMPDRLSLITILSLAEPTMVIFSSRMTSSTLIKYHPYPHKRHCHHATIQNSDRLR